MRAFGRHGAAAAAAGVLLLAGPARAQQDVPATVRSASRTHLLGSIGDGNGRVIVDTGSGGVTLTRG